MNESPRSMSSLRRSSVDARGIEHRPSSHARGYDRRWRRFAERYRNRNPMCVDCLSQGKVEPMEEIHHKLKLADHPELKFDLDNLMALCKQCHTRRTQRGE